MSNLLDHIQSPEDLKNLNRDELKALSQELRDYIIHVIASHPGHLASSLGTIELSVALHYVFNTPSDKIIWDVGHQAYAHKILCERKDIFSTNRTYNGISGFPSRSESKYDAFGVGHSSTSISAALGMAVAASLQGNYRQQHIAVIGDGSMTGGMAFEALNNAGATKSNLLVILNDNGISIDKNTGALHKYLTKMSTSVSYNRFKDRVWDLLGGGRNDKEFSGTNTLFSILKGILSSTKSFFFKESNLFEALNFRYFGPIDGHDLDTLIPTLEKLRNIQGPKLLHIITTKGKGLKTAEENPTVFHAPGIFDHKTGELIKPAINLRLAPKYQDVFGKTIIELAKKNPKIVGITPAMPSGCSLSMMMKVMPERTFDVGIAEQHAVTFAAGLACEGIIPFCNIYSSFMQRAYDQVIHDVALQKLGVIFCLDRAGLVGEDGATHHGVFDLAYFRPIPNMIIASPMNEHELRNLMFTAVDLEEKDPHPFVIRYPRGRGCIPRWKNEMELLPIGKGKCIRRGDRTAVISIGHIGNNALKAIDQYESRHSDKIGFYNMIFLKPLDEALLHEIFGQYERIITLENGCIKGGLADSILEFANLHHYTQPIVPLGIPDRFIYHGKVEELQRECGIDATGILNQLEKA